MVDFDKAGSLRTAVDYATGADAGAGSISGGHCLRKYDGILATADSLELRTSSGRGREASVEFAKPLALPGLLAELTLEPSDDQTADGLKHRLAFRDEMAEAFEVAARKLRSASRT